MIEFPNIFGKKDKEPEGPKAPGRPEKPPRNPDIDENGLHRDFWPVRDRMQKWVDEHRDDFGTFLNYKNAKFKIVCGVGFYHEPARDIISFSVPFFQRHLEKGDMTLDQIFFVSLHEFAHLKTMMELDRAGKHNQLEQFKYEGKKVIRDKEDPTRYAKLTSAYRGFYNILEDGIVNHLVLSTAYFGSHVSTQSRQRAEQIKSFYIDVYWEFFEEVPEGQGTHVKKEGPVGPQESHYEFVGEGKGNLRMLHKEDFDRGFDFRQLAEPGSRSSHLLNIFMETQMLGLRPEDIYDEEKNPEGKFKTYEETALALTQPLVKVYETLLKKIIEKYRGDPDKWERYTQFMKAVIAVPYHKEENHRVVLDKKKTDYVPNVIPPMTFNKKTREINVPSAVLLFKDKVREMTAKMGFRRVDNLTFLDVYNQFKKHKRSQEYSWTLPLEINLVERSKIMRNILEPIFSMLCILDDSFDVTLPPETKQDGGEGEKGEGEGKNENPPEKREWQVGSKVRNRNPQGPYNGRKGIITEILSYDEEGNPDKVRVEYFEEKQEETREMAGTKRNFGVEIEDVENPNQNLKLISRKGQSSSESQRVDPNGIDVEFEDEEGEETEGEEGEEGKAEENEGEEDKDSTKESKKKGHGKGKGSGENEEEDPDLAKTIKQLEDLIAKDDREANLEELKGAKQTKEYRERKGDLEKAEELLEALRKAKAAGRGEGVEPEEREFSDEEVVKKFIELEKKIAPYAEKMAQAWLEIINNIATRIEVVRDKYYRSGRADIKKMQKFLPEMEMGAEIDQRLIYEQFVEKITTEIRPKMLRLTLVPDNSGSMGGKLDELRMCLMLMDASLRSLRILFRNKMEEIFGASFRKDMDLVTDSEIMRFGSGHKNIRPYDFRDLSFLEREGEEEGYPEIDVNSERVKTLLAFQKLTASEGSEDASAWAEIVLSHDNPLVRHLLKENKMTEIILQLSDGALSGDKVAIAMIQKLREMGVGTAGLAIGDDGDPVENLAKRHDLVIEANEIPAMVDKFGDFLKKIVADRVEKPMVDYLEKMG